MQTTKSLKLEPPHPGGTQPPLQVAIKLYHKSKLSELNHFQVAREVKIHGGLDHKHIVQMVGAAASDRGPRTRARTHAS